MRFQCLLDKALLPSSKRSTEQACGDDYKVTSPKDHIFFRDSYDHLVAYMI